MIHIPTPASVPVDVLQALSQATLGNRYCAMLLASKGAWDASQLESNPPVQNYFQQVQSDFLTRANQILPDNWLASRGILPDRLLLMHGETVIEWFEDEQKGLD